jgi:hypothetical protein
MSIDFHPTNPSLLCVGLYDGTHTHTHTHTPCVCAFVSECLCVCLSASTLPTLFYCAWAYTMVRTHLCICMCGGVPVCVSIDFNPTNPSLLCVGMHGGTHPPTHLCMCMCACVCPLTSTLPTPLFCAWAYATVLTNPSSTSYTPPFSTFSQFIHSKHLLIIHTHVM